MSDNEVSGNLLVNDAKMQAILEQRDQLFETAQAYREANRSARAQLAQVTAERDAMKAAINEAIDKLDRGFSHANVATCLRAMLE